MACLTMVLAICNFNCTPNIAEYDMHIPIVSHESHEKETFSITPVITLKQSSYVIMFPPFQAAYVWLFRDKPFPAKKKIPGGKLWQTNITIDTLHFSRRYPSTRRPLNSPQPLVL